jgi:hypothetical protein
MQYGLTNKISAHIFNHHLSRLTEYKSAYVHILIFISLVIGSSKLT